MKINFQVKVLGAVAVASIICTVAAVVIAKSKLRYMGEHGRVEKAEALMTRFEVGRKYVADMNILGDLVQEMVRKYPDGKLSQEDKMRVLRAVPVFASLKLGSERAAQDGYEFRTFAVNPRNPDAVPTPEERKIWEQFAADKTLKELKVENEEEQSITVYRPVFLSEAEGCMTCHGAPSTSPWGNGKDILGYDLENMKDGDLKGVFAVKASLKEAYATASTAGWEMALWAGVFALVALVLAFFFVRGPIARIREASLKLSSSGDTVSSSSEELASISTSLSNNATQAAASIEETAASLEELSTMVTSNAENAKNAYQMSEECKNSADQGASEMRNLGKAMGEITDSSKKVQEITSIIEDIAFQTNLLALNAAVEAARAGEHGKGFAVVAEAVRNLAQKCASAAKEINTLIDENVKHVESGGELVRNATEVLGRIVDLGKKVATLNSEISAASEEQATGIGEINKAMNQLDKTSQANAAASEEAAASVESLNEQARLVRLMAEELIGVVQGSSDGSQLAAHLAHSPSAPKRKSVHVAAPTPVKPKAKAPTSKFSQDSDDDFDAGFKNAA